MCVEDPLLQIRSHLDNMHVLGLSDIIVLAIYRDILKVSISRYLLINYHDIIPVHYCRLKGICYAG